MKVYLNSITGIDDAIVSMFMSKRTWTRELENDIRETCREVTDFRGSLLPSDWLDSQSYEKYDKWLTSLVTWGWKHTTMLRFIDMSITVEGLHRGGQDDWDSHAKRFNNRIIRSSTRLATFESEKSDWYKDKIISTDDALTALGMLLPNEIEHDGKTYVKRINGYILKGYENSTDAKRGLYMLSIPSNFIFKIDLCEWGHVYKERNEDGTANPEVKMLCENIADCLEGFQPKFDRAFCAKILN